MPFWCARGLEKANLSGGIWTALRMPELVRTQHEAFYALMQEVDGIVALSEWARTVLVRNGVPASKITLLQHWLPTAQDTQEPLHQCGEDTSASCLPRARGQVQGG